LPQIALQPQPATPNQGVHDFFAAIFAGPIMFAHALRPVEPQYGTSPANDPAYAPQAYASPSQADRVDYSIVPKFLRQTVAYNGSEAPGTIIVDTTNKFIYLVEGEGRALRYGIGVGRPGFLWSGIKTVTAKRECPDWTPPAEMLARRPNLLRFMPGGVDNPLGARALSRLQPLPHPWLERAVDYRNQRVVRLRPRAQRGRDRPLRARENRHQGHRDLSSRMSERITALGKQPRKTLAEQEGIFTLAQIRQRIELPQLAIDFAGMAHDEAAVRQAIEKSDE
jgi:hypothetical protein